VLQQFRQYLLPVERGKIFADASNHTGGNHEKFNFGNRKRYYAS
jgi:hypothetical protein